MARRTRRQLSILAAAVATLLAGVLLSVVPAARAASPPFLLGPGDFPVTDGGRLVAASTERAIVVYDLVGRSRRVLRHARLPYSFCFALAVSGPLVVIDCLRTSDPYPFGASPQSRAVHVWDLRSNRLSPRRGVLTSNDSPNRAGHVWVHGTRTLGHRGNFSWFLNWRTGRMFVLGRELEPGTVDLDGPRLRAARPPALRLIPTGPPQDDLLLRRGGTTRRVADCTARRLCLPQDATDDLAIWTRLTTLEVLDLRERSFTRHPFGGRPPNKFVRARGYPRYVLAFTTGVQGGEVYVLVRR